MSVKTRDPVKDHLGALQDINSRLENLIKLLWTKQIFIRNLSYDTTKDDVETLFSEIGPVKRCFTVTKPNDRTQCVGNAFLWFSIEEHAKKAIAQMNGKMFKGRKISVMEAKPKLEPKEQSINAKKREEREEKKKEAEISVKVEPVVEEQDNTAMRQGKKPMVTGMRPEFVTIVVNNYIDGKEEVAKHLGLKLGAIQSIKPVFFSDSTVRVVCWNDTVAADVMAKMKVASHNGKPLLFARETEALTRNELVIRNLPFSASIKGLREKFAPFGEILWIKVPTTQSKTGTTIAKGFAFVLFVEHSSAEKAITELNGTSIHKRQIAIDWALRRDDYQAIVAKEAEVQKTQEADVKKEDSGEDDYSDEEDDDEEDTPGKTIDFNSDEEDEEDENEDLERFGSDDDQDEDMEDGDDMDGDEDMEDGEDDEDMDDDEFDGGLESKEERMAREKEERAMDKDRNKKEMDEGKTLFIRNVSFDTTEEEVTKKFEEFGSLKFCRLVLDNVTKRPSGKAFVKFLSAEDAKRAVDASKVTSLFDPTKDMYESREKQKQRKLKEKKNDFSLTSLLQGGIVVGGRSLIVDLAVDHDKATAFKDKKVLSVDKKNKSLLNIGKVLPDSVLGKELNDKDWKMRNDAERDNLLKLKVNPNYYVSPTRLCFRNLPLSVGDKHLKAACLRVMKKKDIKTKVLFAKISSDKTRLTPDGVPRSKGFGFVEFEDHQAALSVLHSLNNSLDAFKSNGSKDQRSFIQFAVEDARAVRKQQDRMKKIKERNFQDMKEVKLNKKLEKKEKEAEKKERAAEDGGDDDQEEGESSTKEPSRGKKQREKRRLAKEKNAALGIVEKPKRNPEEVREERRKIKEKEVPQHIQEKMLKKLKNSKMQTQQHQQKKLAQQRAGGSKEKNFELLATQYKRRLEADTGDADLIKAAERLSKRPKA
eukprot:gene9778-11418_t